MASTLLLLALLLLSLAGSVSAFLPRGHLAGRTTAGSFASCLPSSRELLIEAEVSTTSRPNGQGEKTFGISARRSPRMNAGPSVLEPPTKEEVEEKVEKKKEGAEDPRQDAYTKKGGWAVRLFNDPFNKREFVSMVLCKICGLTDGQSYQVMMQAHQNGVSVVGRYDFERAELYKVALSENGLVCDMIPVEED